METKKKTISLHCFLIKEGVEAFDECLKKEYKKQCKSFALREDLKIEGKICIGKSMEKSPNWKDFLESGTSDNLPPLFNKSTKSAIFLKVEDRIFAFTFGFGRYLLEPECVVEDFGFRVCLNTIDHDKIKSIDKANLEELTVQSRIQVSRSTSTDAFGIDVLNDLVRSVTGVPKDQDFANVVSGKDAVAFSTKVDFSDLPEKCSFLLDRYSSMEYKEYFDWIDKLQEEKDKSVIKRLESELINDLKNRNFDKMHLAPPEIIEWSNNDGFKYQLGAKSEKVSPELDIEKYVNSLSGLPKLTFEKIKKHKIIECNSESGMEIDKWPIHKCLNYETRSSSHGSEDDSYHHIFTLGKWYRVENVFYNQLIEDVKKIEDFDGKLDPCKWKEEEGDYNSRVAEGNDDYILLDRICIKSRLASSSIEPCDILTKDGKFIHVKHKNKSSSLSHLFSQGRISAESLLRDKSFRDKLVKKVESKYGIVLDCIPLEEDSVKASNYEVVFAIIDNSNKTLIESIPFFSLLNLRQAARSLYMQGFKVSIKKIEVRDN